MLAELIGDAGFRIAPLTDVDAEELVTGGQGRQARRAASAARPPADADALTDLSTGSRGSGEDLPEVAELDLNPVVGRPGRLCRGRRPGAGAPPDRPQRLKTW